jgi:hypothetical protein
LFGTPLMALPKAMGRDEGQMRSLRALEIV